MLPNCVFPQLGKETNTPYRWRLPNKTRGSSDRESIPFALDLVGSAHRDKQARQFFAVADPVF